MKPNFCGFLLLTIVPSLAFADVGTDKRRYAEWNAAPYNNYVRVCSNAGCGTGQFISAAHILTSKGSAGCCGVSGKPECVVYTSDGGKYLAKLVQAGGGLSKCDGAAIEGKTHWGVLELQSRDDILTRLKSKNFGFKSGTSTANGLWRGGFGDLKVLTDQDVKDIKNAYAEWLKLVYPYNTSKRDAVAERGANMELEGYDIYENNGAQFATFLNKFKELTGKDFIADYLGDSERFKVIDNCSLKQGAGGVLVHDCAAWSGDGGSAILNNKNEIVALTTFSMNSIDGAGIGNLAVSTNDIFSTVKEILGMPIVAERRPDTRNVNDTIYYHANGDTYMRTGGTAAWRNNNIGNINYELKDSRVIGHGGPKKKNSLRGRFAVFASEQEGREALRTMLRGPRYGSLTILQAMNKYAPASDGNNPGQYARTIASAIKKPLTTRLSSLSDTELDVVINQIRKKEGWKAGQIIDCNANPTKCK